MNAVVIKNEGVALALNDMDFGDGGFGEITSTDIIIPRLSVVNQLSPQIKKGDQKYIAGAEYGDIVDVSNNVIVAKGFNAENPEFAHLLPFARQKEAIEWIPRNKGGGIKGRWPLTVTIEKFATGKGAKQNDKGHWITKDGNEIVETWSVFFLDLNTMRPVVLSFKKSGIGAVKSWFSNRATWTFPKDHPNAGRTRPLFYKSIMLSSFEAKKDADSWANYVVSEGTELPELPEAEDVYAVVTTLFKQYQDGMVKADADENEDGEEDTPF